MRVLLTLVVVGCTLLWAKGDSFPSCAVCGGVDKITKIEAVVDIEGRGIMTCSLLQEEGFDGKIAPELCASLPGLVRTPCGCRAAPHPPCRLCPESQQIANPAATIDLSFFGIGLVDCSRAQQGALEGFVDASFCPSAMSYIEQSSCGCEPIPTALPTSSPVVIPTQSPTSAPSLRPSVAPVSTPTEEPTKAPTSTVQSTSDSHFSNAEELCKVMTFPQFLKIEAVDGSCNPDNNASKLFQNDGGFCEFLETMNPEFIGLMCQDEENICRLDKSFWSRYDIGCNALFGKDNFPAKGSDPCRRGCRRILHHCCCIRRLGCKVKGDRNECPV